MGGNLGEPRYEQAQLQPSQEDLFRYELMTSPWYQNAVGNEGWVPNLNDSQYDYRRAWQYGLVPGAGKHWMDMTPDGKYWLKNPYTHPTAFMEDPRAIIWQMGAALDKMRGGK